MWPAPSPDGQGYGVKKKQSWYGRLTQEDHECQASLGYLRTYLKKNNKQEVPAVWKVLAHEADSNPRTIKHTGSGVRYMRT
jgi:hypothetical protein